MIPYDLNPMGINFDKTSDLDILRQIRNANPTSQLPNMWLDTEDPYTQWEGVTWNAEKTRVTLLDVNSRQVLTLQNVNKLTALQILYCSSTQLTALNVSGLTNLQVLNCYSNQLTELNVDGLTNLQTLICSDNQLTALNVTGLTALQDLDCAYNQLAALNIDGLTNLQYLYCNSNQLTTIPTLTSKGVITSYNFTYNKFPTVELNRFRAMGFTYESKLLPQNP